MKRQLFTLLAIAIICVGCNSANHGSFISQSFENTAAIMTEGADTTTPAKLITLGSVEGKSCQTMSLYLIPMGESVSTAKAIEDAKSQITGTLLLTDISIDDKLWVEVGYSIQCILVTATAYGR